MKDKRILAALLTIFLCISGGIYAHNLNKDYIEGNVLNIPVFINNDQHGIIPPWAANGLISHLLYRTLFLADPTITSFTPDLAQSYSVSENMLVYTIVLKEDQLWSDNTPITAYDVKLNLDGLRKTKNAPSYFQEFFKKIRTIEANDNSITIILNETHAYTIQTLSQFIILPRQAIENKSLDNFFDDDFWNNPITSGMYMLSSQDDQHIELKLNPYYNGITPEIEKIILHHNNFKFDLYITDNISDMIHYRSMRGLVEYKIPALSYKYLAFNIQDNDGFTNPAMQDINSRKAIAEAIDRVSILKNIYADIGAIPDHKSVISKENIKPYNPENAKDYLKNSTYDLSRPVRLAYYFDDAISPYLIQHIAKDLESLGFKVSITKGTSLENLLAHRNFDILLHEFVAMYPIDRMQEYSSEHQFARIYGSGKEFDSLLSELRQNQNLEDLAVLSLKIYNLAEEKFYRHPLVALNQAVYLNSHRVSVPSTIGFGNPDTIFNFKFHEWEILKK